MGKQEAFNKTLKEEAMKSFKTHTLQRPKLFYTNFVPTHKILNSSYFYLLIYIITHLLCLNFHHVYFSTDTFSYSVPSLVSFKTIPSLVISSLT